MCSMRIRSPIAFPTGLRKPAMRRKIPSTAALISFEAAARHQSFTKAADELALTQSAICRQIAGLEAFLGIELFRHW